MSEHMKVQATGEFADISIWVPAAHGDRVWAVIENVLALIPNHEGGGETDEDQPTSRAPCFLPQEWSLLERRLWADGGEAKWLSMKAEAMAETHKTRIIAIVRLLRREIFPP